MALTFIPESVHPQNSEYDCLTFVYYSKLTTFFAYLQKNNYREQIMRMNVCSEWLLTRFCNWIARLGDWGLRDAREVELARESLA